jgi:transmembrane sensor
VDMSEIDIDDLIGKVLASEASAEEQEYLDKWRRANAYNQRYFDRTKAIFDSAASYKVKVTFDTDQAWKSMKARLNHPASGAQVDMHTNRSWPALRIAAGLVLLAVASYYAYQWALPSTGPVIEMVADATTAQDTLPDGTTAFLNKKSSITFAEDKKTGERKVELKGEGFFEVKHEEEKPFVIEAEETLVRDLGTAFNVKAYPGDDTVEVVVQSGVVQFYTANDPGLSLKAGETGLYSKRSKSFTRLARADTNVFAYKTGVFAFHSTDLRSVVERINEVYDSKISLGSEKIGDCRLTVNFTNEQLDTIVDVIAETFALEVERKNPKEIILKGSGCQ